MNVEISIENKVTTIENTAGTSMRYPKKITNTMTLPNVKSLNMLKIINPNKENEIEKE